ncbi:PH domain-containing protein [Actinomycetes bacterium KLBMP 9797]
MVTVTNTQFRRVYRNSGHEVWFVLAPAMLVGVLLVVRFATYDDVPVIVPIGIALVFAAVVGYGIRSVYRTATIADDAHLTIVGLTGTRQIAWRDVQGIEIELRRTRPPMQVAVVYDAAGGKRDLPHVNEHSLVTALPAEVGQLRRIWELRRGDDWKPTSPAAQIAYDRRYPTPAWAIGLVGGFVGLVVGVALSFILLASDAYADGDGFASTYLRPFVLLFGLPAAGAVLTGVAVAVRRRAGS